MRDTAQSVAENLIERHGKTQALKMAQMNAENFTYDYEHWKSVIEIITNTNVERTFKNYDEFKFFMLGAQMQDIYINKDKHILTRIMYLTQMGTAENYVYVRFVETEHFELFKLESLYEYLMGEYEKLTGKKKTLKISE